MMESPDVKPDLSTLKREFNGDLGDQPANNKSRRTDIENASSSSLLRSQASDEENGSMDDVKYAIALIKTESSENRQAGNPEAELEQNESTNADSYTAVQYESSINIKKEQEKGEGISHEAKNQASNQNEDESPCEAVTSSSSVSEPKERLKCKFPKCRVICLGAQARQHHYNLRHVAKIKNTNNNNNSDGIYSSSPPPSATTTTAKKKNNNNDLASPSSSSEPEEIPHQNESQKVDNNNNEIPTSSASSVPATTYRLKCHVSGCKVICLGPAALQLHYNSRHVAKINNNNDDSSPSTTTKSNATSSSSSSERNKNADEDSTSQISCSVCKEQFKNSKSLYKHKFHKHGILEVQSSKNETVSSRDPKASVDQDVMKDTYKLNVPGVSSTDEEFKCPVPPCLRKTFKSLHQLEDHCLDVHRGQTFPWCGPDRILKCPIYGCRRKTFQLQTGLAGHLMAKHGKSASEAASSAALSCSGSDCGSGIDGVEDVEEKEGEKEVFECYFPNCSFTTLVQCQWESHERLHTGDTLRFKCNVKDCGVAFFRSPLLVKHRQVIHGIHDRR